MAEWYKNNRSKRKADASDTKNSNVYAGLNC